MFEIDPLSSHWAYTVGNTNNKLFHTIYLRETLTFNYNLTKAQSSSPSPSVICQNESCKPYFQSGLLLAVFIPYILYLLISYRLVCFCRQKGTKKDQLTLEKLAALKRVPIPSFYGDIAQVWVVSGNDLTSWGGWK